MPTKPLKRRHKKFIELLGKRVETIIIEKKGYTSLDAFLSNTMIKLAKAQYTCGWQDSDTMEHYMNLTGIGVRGATANHRIIPNKAAMAKVVSLVSKK